ncbi:hypothetical protein AVEN_219888-1 [Araneus ventricosus]|uniref:Uncharacterized protein n=1 Tax=Araneus ventricosus TaxID=182803 RepID=A0A4Y2W8H0_ARAVE|nr:hypothetical protein AVEN_219888-1 [Araneus ventricosus]
MTYTDYLAKEVFNLSMIQEIVMLLTVLLPPSFSNEAAMLEKVTIISLPTFFPHQYHVLKIQVEQGFKKKMFFTVWKIYLIDRSVVVSLFGAPLIYGILLGTLGGV